MDKLSPPQSSQIVVTVGVASTAFLPANNRRRGFIVSPPSGAFITISDRQTAVLSEGINVHLGILPYHFCLYQHGDWVKHQLQAIANGAAQTVGIIEILE